MAKKKLLSLENLTFLGALIGFAVGCWAPEAALRTSFLGDIFMTLLKMMIVPLIFVSVFLAVAKQARHGELSSFGSRTLAYFAGSSALACAAGFIAWLVLPKAETFANFVKYDASKLKAVGVQDVILNFFTPNIFRSLANGDIIQIVIVSILLGIACVRVAPAKRDVLIEGADAIHDLVMTVIKWAIVIAPVGVFSLVATTVAKTDAASFAGLGWLFVAIAAAAFLHVLVVLPAIGFFIGRFNPYRFLFNVREPMIVALGTASSSATLPVSTRVLEHGEKVSERTTGFVLPLGVSMNMNGSVLYHAVLLLFLGKVSGIDFTFSQYVLVFFISVLSSAGTAGIPGGGIVIMGTLLQTVGIPLELIGVYLLVDRFWDPPITVINVISNLFGAKTIDQILKRSQPAAVPG